MEGQLDQQMPMSTVVDRIGLISFALRFILLMLGFRLRQVNAEHFVFSQMQHALCNGEGRESN